MLWREHGKETGNELRGSERRGASSRVYLVESSRAMLIRATYSGTSPLGHFHSGDPKFGPGKTLT